MPSKTTRSKVKGQVSSFYGHPVRDALLDLIARDGSTTSTFAARELNESTGTCSFHLRQLASFGLIEPLPGVTGRAKPWRMKMQGAQDATGRLNRELEDTAYATWLETREGPRMPLNSDVGFSEVLSLNPQQIWELGVRMRRTINDIASRTTNHETTNVAVVVRAFPLLDDLSQTRRQHERPPNS
jgi:hypothetical protein